MHAIVSNSEDSPSPKYRADIDGLRAVAVLVVVGYHAFPKVMQGGFIGVDIFFVISGFLISTILFSTLERNNFSFVEFYSRRIKRIFPSLLVLLVACLVFGWFVLTAGQYRLLGKHVVGGAAFISNILFWRESSYFDVAAEAKILLHLWSLGVEEQYYIIWPFLLWLGWRYRANLLAITVVLLLISFTLNVMIIPTNPTAAYFSPFTRFWELLVGSALAYLTLHRHKVKRFSFSRLPNRNLLPNLYATGGALLIVAGLLLISRETPFPGWWALLPVLGSMLIISAGTDAWLNRVILSNRVLVFFGLISYPLYLWHWPLLVFANIMDVEKLSPGKVLFVVALAILLATLTYYFVEIPIRQGRTGSNTVPVLVTSMFIACIGGYVLFLNGGFPGYGYRVMEKSDFESYFENSAPDWKYFKEAGIESAYRFDCNFYNVKSLHEGNPTLIPLEIDDINKSCYTRDPDKKHILMLWGDSHAQQLYYGLKNNLPKDWQVLIIASSGCVPDPYVREDSSTAFCQRSNWFAIQTIKKTKPEAVIVAQADGFTDDKINAISDFLFKTGVGRVIIPGPSPRWNEELPDIIMRDLWENTPERTLIGINQDILNENEYLKSHFPQRNHLVFVDLVGFFCNNSGCLTRIGQNKKLDITTWDIGHLTPTASDYLAKNLLVDIITGDNSSASR